MQSYQQAPHQIWSGLWMTWPQMLNLAFGWGLSSQNDTPVAPSRERC